MTKQNKETGQELEVRQEPDTSRENEIVSLMTQAVNSNASVEVMERLFNLRKDVKAEVAKEQFVAAMARFQGICPTIKKDKIVKNKDGQSIRYKFAGLDSITEQIRKPLSDCGLFYRWETKQENKKVTAICIVTHELGHSEQSDFTIEKTDDGFMTDPQKFASALTYAKRYSLLNALGISTADEDTDATDVKKEKAPVSEKSKIVFLLKTLQKKTGTKDEISQEVEKLTGLELADENLSEIVSRLEVIVQEYQSDNSAHNEN